LKIILFHSIKLMLTLIAVLNVKKNYIIKRLILLIVLMVFIKKLMTFFIYFLKRTQKLIIK
jgi:hypothetical protein